MKIVQAKDVTTDLADMREVHFSEAIMQKRTPGSFTHRFGRADLDIDAVVSYMLNHANNPVEMAKVTDGLSKLMVDRTVTKAIFGKLFTSSTQNLDMKQHLFTVGEAHRQHGAVIGSRGNPGTVSLMTELMVEAFSGTSFISRQEGYSLTEFRTKRFPDANDLYREAIKQEIIEVLRSEPLRLKIDAKKFTPTFLEDEYSRVLERLGRALASTGYTYDAMHDAFYVIYTAMTHQGSLHDKLPEEVVKSSEYAILSSNLTFVDAAFSAAPTRARGGDWQLRNAMRKVITLLNLSAKYDVVPLTTAVAHMRYSPVVDGRSNLVGGVLSYSAPIKHQTNVAMFSQFGTAMSQLRAVPLERYSRDFSALVAPVNGWDVLSDAHAVVESIVSSVVMSELDDDPRSTMWIMGQLSKEDLTHMAVAYADRVYLPVRRGKDVTLDERLAFEVQLRGRRLFADEIPFEDVVITRDPATAILAMKAIEPSISIDLSGQFAPEFIWESIILDDQAEIAWDFNGKYDIDVEVGGSPIRVSLEMIELVRSIAREDAKLYAQPFTASVMRDAFESIHDAKDWVMERLGDNATAISRLKAQVGHQLHSFYEKMAQSDMFQDVLEHVIRRMAKRVSPVLRDQTYLTLEQMSYRLQIQAALVGFVYERMQIMPGVVSEGAASTLTAGDIHQRNMEVWKETDFFPRMIGAARARRVTN